MQFVSHPAGKLTGQFGTLFESDTAYRDKRAHIGGSHAGMRAVMLAHIYDFGCFPDTLECRFDYIFGGSYECDYRAVGGFSRVNIEQTHG